MAGWGDRGPVHDEQASLEEIHAAARTAPIDGILALGDRPTVLAARVAEVLRLPGNPIAGAEASRSKRAMRRAFASAGMRTPWFLDIPADAEARAVAAMVPYPCVVKPLGLSGSRGVIKAESPAQLESAVTRVRALLARADLRAQRAGLTDQLLIEGYIDGQEYAIEGLLTGGEFRVLALFDKPDPLDGPFFEETIYVTPSSAPAHLQDAIAQEVERAITALDLVHGPIHAECRVGVAGITMLEVGARPVGGLCSKVLRFEADGHPAPFEEVLLRHAIGEDVGRYEREARAAGVMMIPIPRRGLYKGVLGEGRATAVPHIKDLRITAKTGQLLEPVPEGDSYLGFIFASAPHSLEVVAALREAHRQLTFDIVPEVRVIR